MGKRLYVGNLPYNADEAMLKEAFGQDGRAVATVHVVMDRETGRPRGFAFVEMASDEDAKKALAAMDGAEFGGRSLRVNEAEDRRGPPSGPRPGGFGGPRPSGPGGAPRPSGPPREGGPPRPGGYSGGSSGGAPSGGGYSGGGGGSAGGGGFSRPKPGWSDPPAEPKKYDNKKPQRRRADEEQDYGGRRGGRRFDDDDEY